jgi:putative ABC transport system permease protein
MNYVEIPLWRLAIALVLILVPLALSWRGKLGLGRDLAWGAVRAAGQLLFIGHVLLLLFRYERPELVLGALTLMLLIAAWTSARRVEKGPPVRVLLPRALAAVGLGALGALVPVFVLVVPPHPWFQARYLVPIGGMMLSSAMNVVALVFQQIFQRAHDSAGEIEQLLALGATPEQALAASTRAAIRTAMIPTINGLMTVGIVALPGMMTGQVVSGMSPEQAVRYQIVIMYQLVAVAAVSGTMAAWLARGLIFDERARLVPSDQLKRAPKR